jgi:hypothetical protein
MKNKYYTAAAAFVAVVLLSQAACKDGPILSSYRPVPPELPGRWNEILGEPRWRLEWIGEDGAWRKWEGETGGNVPGVSPFREWATPVLAWPFWPEKNLLPGMMRPSGAIFPWDVSGEGITLSWKGGVDAVFWKELAAAERVTDAAQGRLPWYLDWPRFRELLESGNIPEAVRLDPWLPDWKEIARKTVQSGFDRRRVVPRKLTEFPVPGVDGTWVGSSPFALPLRASPDTPLLLYVWGVPDTWVSSKGMLRCSTSGYVSVFY